MIAGVVVLSSYVPANTLAGLHPGQTQACQPVGRWLIRQPRKPVGRRGKLRGGDGARGEDGVPVGCPGQHLFGRGGLGVDVGKLPIDRRTNRQQKPWWPLSVAIRVACEMLSDAKRQDAEVGPMVGEEPVLSGEDLRRICAIIRGERP